MDHLDENMGNFVRAKKKPMPFGSLSYFIVQDFDDKMPQSGKIVVVPFGSINLPNLAVQAVNPVGKALEIHGRSGMHEFSAFGLQLPIYLLSNDLQSLAAHIEEEVRLCFEEGVARAEAEGKDPAKLREQPMAGVIFSMAVRLGGETSSEEN